MDYQGGTTERLGSHMSDNSADAMMESHKALRKAGEQMNEPKVAKFEDSLKAHNNSECKSIVDHV